MECESCGRYVPSADVLPVLRGDGRPLMACASCRVREVRDELQPAVALGTIVLAPEPPAVGLAR